MSTKQMRKAKIKFGAQVMQDHSVFYWAKTVRKPNDKEETIFDIEQLGNGRCCCIAIGYGIIGNYGNGAVFTNEKNLIYLDSEEFKIQ